MLGPERGVPAGVGPAGAEVARSEPATVGCSHQRRKQKGKRDEAGVTGWKGKYGATLITSWCSGKRRDVSHVEGAGLAAGAQGTAGNCRGEESPGHNRALSCLLLLSRFSDCKYVPPPRLVSHRSDPCDRVLSSEPQEQGTRPGNLFLVVPGVRPSCSASTGGLGFDNHTGSAAQAAPEGDLSRAAPARATESFTCTKNFTFSHFLKEYMQWQHIKMYRCCWERQNVGRFVPKEVGSLLLLLLFFKETF